MRGTPPPSPRPLRPVRPPGGPDALRWTREHAGTSAVRYYPFLGRRGCGAVANQSGGTLSLDGNPVPLSAPDLIGPWSVVNWADHIPSHRGKTIFHHVRLEVDLAGCRPLKTSALEHLLGLFREEEIAEALDLYSFVSATLSALARDGLGWVESWSLVPGGLLPSDPGRETPAGEALGKALHQLKRVDPKALKKAVGFHARLTGSPGLSAEVTLYQLHRARRPALTLDLWGTIPRSKLQEVLSTLREHLPSERVELTRSSRD